MAASLAKSSQNGRGRDEFERVVRAKPGDADLIMRAVFVFELMGERLRAIEAVREYVRLNGSRAARKRNSYTTEPRFEFCRFLSTGKIRL